MKNFNRLLGGTVALSLMLSLMGPVPTVHAATSPSLGAASSYSVLGQTAITDAGAASSITGDVGMNASGASITGLTVAQVAPGNIFATDLVAPSQGILPAAVQADASTVYTATIPGLPIEGTPIGVSELNGITRGPGVYDLPAGAVTLSGGVLTLNGPGTYIFRITTSLTSSGTVLLTNGARACDVFWNVGSLATINGTSFVGTILSGTGVHFGAGVALDGRALAIGGDVTMISDTISGPSCATAVPPSTGRNYNITVIKTVINDNGRTNTIADFPLFINGLPVTSGVVNNLPVPTTPYVVTETTNVNYARTFSGACDANGVVNMEPGDTKICVITNDDIGAALVVPPVPPLIDVVKTASPLNIPVGPGAVTYTYTLRNVGTVPVSNVTMVGDTCSPIIRISGDTNNNNILEVSETWVHTCPFTLAVTHTNTVVATGWANGISVSDYASATVVVGAAIVPPLIHITKVPSPITYQAGGGLVTYSYVVTNPGTAPLTNVFVTDDKCTGLPGRVIGHPGDLNKNNLLESNEAWQFTCTSNITRTTTNVGTASGEANGLIATDFAVATVIVAIAVPALPKTGFGPAESILPLVAGVAGIMVASVLLYVLRKKQSV